MNIELQQIVSEALNVVNVDDKFPLHEAMTSLKAISVMAAIDDRFEVILETDDIMACETINDLENLIVKES